MGDYRTTRGEPPPVSPRVRRRKRILILLSFFAVVTLISLGGFLFETERYMTAKGFVTTEEYAEVRPSSVGTISTIVVESGSEVAAGDLLVQLDATEERATLEESRSMVSQIEAKITRREAEIEEQKRKLKEDIAVAKLRLKNAGSKLLRTRQLVSKGLKAGSELENDKLAEELASAELTSLVSRDESIFDKELAVMRRELEGRNEAVGRAEARLHRKEVTAPITGKVLRYEFVIGELVKPEMVLFEIFGGDDQVLKLRIAERYAAKVAPGQRYSAKLASFGGLQTVYFEGKVRKLRNVIQAEGRETYRIAYCDFDSGGRMIPPGTTAQARIYYGNSCLWFYLFNIDL